MEVLSNEHQNSNKKLEEMYVLLKTMQMNQENALINIQKNHEFIYCYRRSQIIKGGKILASLGRQSFVEKSVFQEGDKYFYLND